MLDIRMIREKPGFVRRNLERRHEPEKLAILDGLIEVDAAWRRLTTEVNNLRRRRNEISSEIGRLLKEGRDASDLKQEAEAIPKLIRETESKRDTTQVRVRSPKPRRGRPVPGHRRL